MYQERKHNSFNHETISFMFLNDTVLKEAEPKKVVGADGIYPPHLGPAFERWSPSFFSEQSSDHFRYPTAAYWY